MASDKDRPRGDHSLESKKSALKREVLWATALFTIMFLVVTILGAVFIVKDLGNKETFKILANSSKELEQIVRKITTPKTLKGYKQQTVVITRLNTMLTEKKIFDSVKLYNDKGVLVYKNNRLRGGELVGGKGPSNLRPGQQKIETGTKIPIEVTVSLKPGKMGKAILSMSQGVLARQAEDLQSALVKKLVETFMIILVMLVLAYLYILRVLRASRRIEIEAQTRLRLSELGLLSSGLAHEIKNPINSIQMNLQLLEEEIVTGGKDDGEFRSWLVPVRREIKRLERLVNDFLMFSRPLKPKLEACPLSGLLESLVLLVKEEAKRKHVLLEVVVDDEKAMVETDEDLLRSALLNLLLNAIQASEDPGKVTLKGSVKDATVHIDVSDEGKGIPEEERGHVFDVFMTTRQGGTGLGLPIARKLVHEVGGILELLDKDSPGALFRVSIPVAGRSGE